MFATGFDAMTGSLFKLGIRGRGGVALEEQWADGPHTYLGVATAGFPNLFIITGPGQPFGAQQHAGLDRAACRMDRRLHPVSAQPAASTPSRRPRKRSGPWVAHVNELANATLFPQANSWYMGANIPGKPRVFMPYCGGVGRLPRALRRDCGKRLRRLRDRAAESCRSGLSSRSFVPRGRPFPGERVRSREVRYDLRGEQLMCLRVVLIGAADQKLHAGVPVLSAQIGHAGHRGRDSAKRPPGGQSLALRRQRSFVARQ